MRENLHFSRLGLEIFAVEQRKQHRIVDMFATERVAHLCYGPMLPQDENGYVGHALCFVQQGREEMPSQDWEHTVYGASASSHCAAKRRE